MTRVYSRHEATVLLEWGKTEGEGMTPQTGEYCRKDQHEILSFVGPASPEAGRIQKSELLK